MQKHYNTKIVWKFVPVDIRESFLTWLKSKKSAGKRVDFIYIRNKDKSLELVTVKMLASPKLKSELLLKLSVNCVVSI